MHPSKAIADFVLCGGEAVDPPRLAVDLATPAHTFASFRGQFALHVAKPGGEHLLVRDPLGVNKLFFAIPEDGPLEVASYYADLRRSGHPHERIWSVPAGHLVRVSTSRRRLSLERHAAILDGATPRSELGVEGHAARIRERLDATFRALRRFVAGRPVYVSLSGGLDSSTIAAFAREHLDSVFAFTFRVDDGKTATRRDDADYAMRVAGELGLPIEVVTVGRESLLARIDTVLAYGQDFRDFNVHCGLVNAVLAEAIASHARARSDTRPVVLTGDTMNELVADYTPVAYGASTHYPLPRVSIEQLRRVLVRGLDAGDREVGIFAHRGIDTLQPYAFCAEEIAALPPEFLAEPGAKQRLARCINGDRVPSFVYDRPKVRAQVASADEVAGTLAALVDQGVDAAALERRFGELFALSPSEVRGFIRGGCYRFTSTYPRTRRTAA